ncbi:hypothetical protein PV325_007105 [Microctonus aethiopoides]|nr:hypothetical protein PV325_007105 [Microctonus aethiopoides]
MPITSLIVILDNAPTGVFLISILSMTPTFFVQNLRLAVALFVVCGVGIDALLSYTATTAGAENGRGDCDDDDDDDNDNGGGDGGGWNDDGGSGGSCADDDGSRADDDSGCADDGNGIKCGYDGTINIRGEAISIGC